MCIIMTNNIHGSNHNTNNNAVKHNDNNKK